MFLIMAEALQLTYMAKMFPESPAWRFLGRHQDHVQWVGCILHDIIQPSFSFLVGVALPFSIVNRLAKRQSRLRLTVHAVSRALILVFLGIFFRSLDRTQTYFTFEDTLTQIGLGYPLLYFLAWRRVRVQWLALVLILVGYWAAFALYPRPTRTSTMRRWQYTINGPPTRPMRRQALGRERPCHARLRLALEPEQQSGLEVRYVVPEPLPPPGA